MSGLNEATVDTVSRRSFLKRALLGVAAATAASLAASRLLVKGDRSTELRARALYSSPDSKTSSATGAIE